MSIAPHLQPIKPGQDACEVFEGNLRVWIGKVFYAEPLGIAQCPACEGSGREEVDCDVCEGDGTLYSSITHRSRYCPICCGDGRLEVSSKCPECMGTGDVQDTAVGALRAAIRRIASLYSIRFKCDPREIERRILASRSDKSLPETPE